MSELKYRPAIDGLRAIAILPVVIFHLGAQWFPGGFIGVDVFFVISGYLITSILLKEQQNGTFTFKQFWFRRVRRILPALFAMLIATLVAGFLILFPMEWKNLGQQGVSVVCLVANIFMLHMTGNYWGPLAENAPLLHVWSLSLEEQFYLFYPAMLFITLRYCAKRVLAIVLILTLASFASCILLTRYNAAIAFYLLPTRAWELGVGCLLAIFEYKRRSFHHVVGKWVSLIGILLIGLSCVFIHSGGFPGFKAVIPVIGAAIVIFFSAQQSCLSTRLLSIRPLVYIGKISYSLYLWHWPIIVLGKAWWIRSNSTSCMYLLLIPIVSVISYHFIEQPTRKMNGGLLLPTGLVAGTSLFLSFYLSVTSITLDTSAYSKTEWLGEAYNCLPHPVVDTGQHMKDRMNGIAIAERTREQSQAYLEGGIIRRYGSEFPEIVVLGSSHALMWAPTIDSICKNLGITCSFYAADATPGYIEFPIKKRGTPFMTPKEKFDYDSKRVEFITKWHPKLLIIGEPWSPAMASKYQAFLEAIKSPGMQVLFIEQPPVLAIGDINAPQYIAFIEHSAPLAKELSLKAENIKALTCGRDAIRSLSSSLPFAHTLPVADLFLTQNNRVLVRENRDILYIDDDHLSYKGAEKIEMRLQNKIKELLNQSSP